MKLEGKYKFEATQERVWEVFTNPRHLERAIPGCERLEETEPGKYDALLKIGIAAVKGTYTGKFEIADPEKLRRYRLIGEGSGNPGFVKGEGVITLTGENGKTLVSYQGDVQVGGLIAGVGQRLISGIAKMMLNQFFKKMKKEIRERKERGTLLTNCTNLLL
jgi:carbon monoxide dehydrogenase subunit G